MFEIEIELMCRAGEVVNWRVPVCSGWHCIAEEGNGLQCSALDCTGVYWITLECTGLHLIHCRIKGSRLQ